MSLRRPLGYAFAREAENEVLSNDLGMRRHRSVDRKKGEAEKEREVCLGCRENFPTLLNVLHPSSHCYLFSISSPFTIIFHSRPPSILRCIDPSSTNGPLSLNNPLTHTHSLLPFILHLSIIPSNENLGRNPATEFTPTPPLPVS
jgi:hypothetical protein